MWVNYTVYELFFVMQGNMQGNIHKICHLLSNGLL